MRAFPVFLAICCFILSCKKNNCGNPDKPLRIKRLLFIDSGRVAHTILYTYHADHRLATYQSTGFTRYEYTDSTVSIYIDSSTLYYRGFLLSNGFIDSGVKYHSNGTLSHTEKYIYNSSGQLVELKDYWGSPLKVMLATKYTYSGNDVARVETYDEDGILKRTKIQTYYATRNTIGNHNQGATYKPQDEHAIKMMTYTTDQGIDTILYSYHYDANNRIDTTYQQQKINTTWYTSKYAYVYR